MKPLFEYLMEAINESNTFPLCGANYISKLIRFAAKFDKFNSKEEADWAGWDDCHIDPEWAMKNKSLVKKFCDLCKKIENNGYISYNTISLGNFSLYDWDNIAFNTNGAIYDELGVEGGDYVLMYATDGDDGLFFQMTATNKTASKLIDEFAGMTHDIAGRDIEVMEIPEKDSF